MTHQATPATGSYAIRGDHVDGLFAECPSNDGEPSTESDLHYAPLTDMGFLFLPFRS